MHFTRIVAPTPRVLTEVPSQTLSSLVVRHPANKHNHFRVSPPCGLKNDWTGKLQVGRLVRHLGYPPVSSGKPCLSEVVPEPHASCGSVSNMHPTGNACLLGVSSGPHVVSYG